MSNDITPCLWFDDQGQEAAEFYTSVFPSSKITEVQRYPEGTERAGSVMVVAFELNGRPFTALNGGPQFTFNEAVSFQIDCADQVEVDAYWDQLTAGGEPGPCGWAKDRYGVWWQVVPRRLNELLSDSDPQTAARVMDAMLKMGKIEIAPLEEAAAAAPA